MNTVSRMLDLVGRIPLTITLSIVAVIMQCWANAPEWFGYQWKPQVFEPSYRVITCNWLHFSWNHLAWDLAVFAVLGALCELRNRVQFAWMLAVSSIAIPLMVKSSYYELGTYRGLSGIDSGLFAMLGLSLLIEHSKRRDWRIASIFAASLIALVVKIGWEICLNGNIFVSDQSFVPVPLAHMTGVWIGLMIAVVWQTRPISYALASAT